MKKNIILAIVGVVFMLGLVGCPQEEAWQTGAPSDITGKIWVDTVTTTSSTRSVQYNKWDADGTRYTKMVTLYNDETTDLATKAKTKTWSTASVYSIAKYRTGEVETTTGTKYKYTISGGHMSWEDWFTCDETTDVVD